MSYGGEIQCDKLKKLPNDYGSDERGMISTNCQKLRFSLRTASNCMKKYITKRLKSKRHVVSMSKPGILNGTRHL